MISTASYFGLEVTVIAQMETCALIRFQGHDLILDTADLTASDALTAASAPLRQMAACSRGLTLHRT